MLRIDEHRAAVGSYGYAGDFIAGYAGKQPPQFTGANIGDQQLVIDGVA